MISIVVFINVISQQHNNLQRCIAIQMNFMYSAKIFLNLYYTSSVLAKTIEAITCRERENKIIFTY